MAELGQRLVFAALAASNKLPNTCHAKKDALLISSSQAASWDEGFAPEFFLSTSNAWPMAGVILIPCQLAEAPLIAIAATEFGDFEFDGFLEHELSAQADGFRERGMARPRNCSSRS